VHPDAYRLRILNACNTRTMQLRFARSSKSSINPLNSLDLATLLPMFVVGNDGGFLPQVQPPTTTLQIGPAERYDVVVDFSGVC
jgi:FtsP/CotA-like multicopper oxidase with cupredoxin domain